MPSIEEVKALVGTMDAEQVRALALQIEDPEILDTLEEYAASLEAPVQPGPLHLYHDRPAAFARDLVKWPEGGGLITYQAEVLDGIVEHGRYAVRGPHGISKTATAALAILWFALTRDAAGEDWKIATTAYVWAQLIHYLWPEVHKWARLLRWDVMERAPLIEGRELLMRTLKLRTGEAFAASPDDAAAIEGAHAEQLLYVFDEAKTIPPDVWDAVEGAFAGAGANTGQTAYALAISTPGEPSGRFYEIHKHKPGTEDWHTRHVKKAEAVEAGRMSEPWAEQRAKQWGPNSALYQNRVEGEFASSDEDGVIPLSWVEQAMDRWKATFGEHGELWTPPSHPEVIGVDCSGAGKDKTVFAYRYGDLCGPLERPQKKSLETGDEEMATAGRIVALLKAYAASRAVVDAGGLGSSIIGRCREQVERRRVVAFIAGASVERKDKAGIMGFANVRSAAWWHMREILDPADGSEVMLPPDDQLLGDLCAPHWKEQSKGVIQVEPKPKIKLRLGRSTDDGDAVVQAYWGPQRAKVRGSGAVQRSVRASTGPR